MRIILPSFDYSAAYSGSLSQTREMKYSLFILISIVLIGCNKNAPVSQTNTSDVDTLPKLIVDTLRIIKGEKIKEGDTIMSSYLVWHMQYHFTRRPSSADYWRLKSEPEIFNYAKSWFASTLPPDTMILYHDTIFSRWGKLAKKDSIYKIRFDVQYWSYDKIWYVDRQLIARQEWADSLIIKW